MKVYLFGILCVFMTCARVLHAEESEWKVYATVPSVERLLSKYKDEMATQRIVTMRDADLRFLTLINELLDVQRAYEKCEGSHFINVGYVSPDGRGVTSGITPESVEDPELRKGYVGRIAQNEDNWKTVQKISSIRKALLGALQETAKVMKEPNRSIAKEIAEKLSVSRGLR